MAEPTFETALAELDRILVALEDGTTTLDDALAKYERGVALLRQCYGQLQSAEQKIQQLTGVDEAGRPVLAPFEHTATISKSDPAAATKKKKKDGDTPF
jgi:exodeoxyribonuclease VII small subunit